MLSGHRVMQGFAEASLIYTFFTIFPFVLNLILILLVFDVFIPEFPPASLVNLKYLSDFLNASLLIIDQVV